MSASSKNLIALLALALGTTAAGCAADAPDGPDGPGGGSGSGSGEEEVTPTDATGKYSMRSNFDLATNAPGKVGEVVSTIIAATDGGDDPANWILEQVIAKMQNGTVKTLLNGARPFIAGYLNERLLDFAPDFVTTMVQVGNDFGQMAKNFGTNETLDVSGAPGAYTSVHTVTGAHFKIDNIESDLAFSTYMMPNVAVPAVGVTLSATGQFGVAEHKVPLTYGKILKVGLDGVLIPMINPAATNLGQLIQGLVDCNQVGTLVASQIGGFGAGAITTACNLGLVAGAGVIYSKIDGIDGSALEFGLTGTARAIDSNGDKKIDKIQTGTWAGTMSYAGTPSPLSAATFYGERM